MPFSHSNRHDDVVVRASALKSVDQRFISPSGVIPKTEKWYLTASLLGAWHKSDSVENKPASLLVVSLGKPRNGMPSLCGRQVTGPSSLPVVMVRCN